MKKIGFLPLLSITPLLMGLNAVPPYSYPDAYEDFEVSNFALGAKEDERYPFSLELENKGEGYIQLNDFTFQEKKQESNYYYYIDSCGDLVIASLFLAPKQKTPASGRVDFEASYEDLIFRSRAFKTYSFKEAGEIKNTALTTSKFDTKTYYEYHYEIVNLVEDEDYYYSYLVEFVYDDITYAVQCYSETFYISFLKEIDPDKDVTFGRVVTIQGRERRNNNLSSIWITIWIVVGILFTLGFFVSVVVVPIVLSIRKPWRK